MPHVFISYVQENFDEVQRLGSDLNVFGAQVFTRDMTGPGSRKKTTTRRAIRDASFFIACFSKEYHASGKTEMNEELNLAIEQLRQRAHDQSWFIPIKLTRCEIPDIDIGGAGETIQDLKAVELYKDWDAGVKKIIKVIQSKSMEITSDVAQDKDDVLVIPFLEETEKQSFKMWTGAERAILALVFTDVVGSTVLGNQVGDESMDTIRRAHFKQARKLIKEHNGYEVKTIGDSFMVAFRTAVKALDFVLDLYGNTGHERVKIRAVIHVGPVQIEEDDAFGSMVNYTSRVERMVKGAEIWVSDRAKSDIDCENAARHISLRWNKHPNCELTGFEGKHTFWSVVVSAEATGPIIDDDNTADQPTKHPENTTRQPRH